MTCKTSAAAVCCSKASRVSVRSRAFSIAMTACAAKFCNSAICLSVKGRTLAANRRDVTDKHTILAQRHEQHSADARCIEGLSCYRMVNLNHIGDVDKISAVQQRFGNRIVGNGQPLSQVLCPSFRICVCRHSAEPVPVAERQASVVCAAEGVRLL